MSEVFDISWEVMADPGGAAKWDEHLLNAVDYNVYQSWAWGVYKHGHGWIPFRCIGKAKSGRVVGMAQVLVKKLPMGISAGWAPGGPVIRFMDWSPKKTDKILGSLRQFLENELGVFWVRFHSHLPTDPELAYSFSGRLHRPFFKVNSEFSINLDLGLGAEEFEQSMTSKHRYYVRQALGHEIEWRYGRDEELQQGLSRLHAEMTDAKGMASIRMGEKEIADIVSALGEQAAIFSGYSNGEAITSCLLLTLGDKAFYAIAANGVKGREFGAAYAMILRLHATLKSRGFRVLDFAGLDPKTSAASGVNHFKRGFGGDMVEYLGEWECASSEKLRYAMNAAIRLRGGRL